MNDVVLSASAFMWRNLEGFAEGIGGENGWKDDRVPCVSCLFIFPDPFEDEPDREGGAPEPGATWDEEVDRLALALVLA